MKIMATYLFVLCLELSVWGRTNDISDISALISSVKETVGVETIAAFPDPAPIYPHSAMNHDFEKLSDLSKGQWQEALENLTTVAPDRESRIIFLHSLLYLPPREYLKCLSRLLDLYVQEQIPQEEFINIFIFSPRDENRWFLSYNAEDPQMQIFLSRARAAFSDNSDILHLLDNIASGKTRSRDERLRTEKPNMTKRTIPSLSKEDDGSSLVPAVVP